MGPRIQLVPGSLAVGHAHAWRGFENPPSTQHAISVASIQRLETRDQDLHGAEPERVQERDGAVDHDDLVSVAAEPSHDLLDGLACGQTRPPVWSVGESPALWRTSEKRHLPMLLARLIEAHMVGKVDHGITVQVLRRGGPIAERVEQVRQTELSKLSLELAEYCRGIEGRDRVDEQEIRIVKVTEDPKQHRDVQIRRDVDEIAVQGQRAPGLRR